jgi:hypothetical protein
MYTSVVMGDAEVLATDRPISVVWVEDGQV